MNKGVKGYKVFQEGWICNPTFRNPFQFKVGEVFEEDVVPKVSERGFHYAENLADCLDTYPFVPSNKFAEVLALGDIDTDGVLSCTNKIKIVREIPFEEVLQMANSGKHNYGYGNSGNRNTGFHNSGDHNSGRRNSGNRNSGDRNDGDYNSGDWNKGNNNSGHGNKGNWNSGDRNAGSNNSGSNNLGSYNTGDWNRCDHSNGCFNTIEQKIYLFNKPSDWTYNDWINSEAQHVLWLMPSDPDKRQPWWNSVSQTGRNAVLSLPNFDKGIFKEITGIDADTEIAEITKDMVQKGYDNGIISIEPASDPEDGFACRINDELYDMEGFSCYADELQGAEAVEELFQKIKAFRWMKPGAYARIYSMLADAGC